MNFDNTQIGDLDLIRKLESKFEISYQNTPAQEVDQNKIDLRDRDALFDEAARLLVMHQQGSPSLLQRKLKLGYNRAGRLIDQLEAAEVVGAFEGSKAREVLIKDELGLEKLLSNLRSKYDDVNHVLTSQEYCEEGNSVENQDLKYPESTRIRNEEPVVKEIEKGFFRKLIKSLFNI